MRLKNALREARGDRTLRELERQAATKGLTAGTLSLMENGHMLPKDDHLPAIERIYGKPIEELYSPLALRALQEDE